MFFIVHLFRLRVLESSKVRNETLHVLAFLNSFELVWAFILLPKWWCRVLILLFDVNKTSGIADG